MNNKMIHLHLHTEYSFLDGANRIKDMMKRCKELNMDTIAITDHNHIGGWYEFRNQCKENNIKPIFGLEIYQTYDINTLSKTTEERYDLAIKKAKDNGIEIPTKINGKKITKKQINELIADYTYDTKQYHLILLAMNQTGLNNLIKLQSEASLKCTYNGRYCCDMNMLNKYNEGIICLSACLGGFIPNKIINNKLDEAENFLLDYKNIFGDRFYLEIQPLFDNNQYIANNKIIELAIKHDIKLVATNDVHYTYKEDFEDHDTLLCIGIGKKKSDIDRMKYEHEFWIRSYEEMIQAFNRYDYNKEIIEEAIYNTNLIAERIEDDIKLGSDKPLFPKVKVPKGMTAEQYLTLKSYKALYKYKNEHPEIDIIKYEQRLYEELDIINSKGFAPYMLTIFENVEYCESVDIPVGPGRGSAAGSLCLFVNGGTKVVDPIKYDLLFFRFLTRDRVEAPDVDVDFSYNGRNKLIKYLEETHGKEKVCHIGTYTVLGVKNGLKDFGRVLDVDFITMNNITKKIDEITDETPGIKFKHLDGYKEDAEEALELGDEVAYNTLIAKYNEFKALEEEYKELFRLARKFEGTPRNVGCHASGILVTPCNITDYFPTRYDTKTNTIISLFDGPQLESLGAIKLDILGLKTLDVLDKTLKSIDKNLKVNDLYNKIQEFTNDKTMFKQIQNKETEGLFQIESNLFKGLISDIIPTDENDICTLLSLGRPGPLSAGMHTSYANRKNGHELSTPQLRGTDSITKDTYHTIIYQEQCMLIAKLVAGFNDSQADSLCRKPLAKKRVALMNIFRKCFIYGKKNCNPPENYNEEDINQPFYDPNAKYGDEIKGGLSNGYTLEELEEFYEKLKGYASYLFNRSHSASYSIITLCTMYLKTFYKAKFFAALLSMQTKEEKIDLYCKTIKDYGIEIKTPDINKSDYDFVENNNIIYYGFKSIKGVGEASIPEIINNRPYKSLTDAKEKLSTKAFNKRISTALIKSGAFDFYNSNRYSLLNELASIRKEDIIYTNENEYNNISCMEFEKEVLGSSITYNPWWNTVIPNAFVTKTIQLKKLYTKKDKNNKTMAFLTLFDEGVEFKAIMFSSVYSKYKSLLEGEFITIQGKKDTKDQLIIDKLIPLVSFN